VVAVAIGDQELVPAGEDSHRNEIPVSVEYPVNATVVDPEQVNEVAAAVAVPAVGVPEHGMTQDLEMVNVPTSVIEPLFE